MTTAETVISAKSGQTVVMAGLITSDKSMTLRRVPWLADIPIVGRLFEFEDSVDRRTELMIIMTPHIIESDEDYEWIKAMESERMSWCLADVVNLHGDVGLQGNNSLFCCENLPIIYPHSNPVGFEMAPFPTNELGLPPVDFSESEEPLFDSNPVVPSEWQGPPAPLPTQANSRLPSPAAQGAPVYETRVRYGPAPVGAGIAQLQQIIVEPAEVRRLPETQR